MVAAIVGIQSKDSTSVVVDGKQSLTDVAHTHCGDVRLTPLLEDLNPALPTRGVLRAGVVVRCPSTDEAQRFAHTMGFTIGFDPSADNGTDARRRWAKHVGGGQRGNVVDVHGLARTLLARGVSPSEAGRRIARQCTDAQILSLVSAPESQLRALGEHAECHRLFPLAVARMTAVRNLLDVTARPEGLRWLFEAAARNSTAVEELLAGAAVVPALRTALCAEAPRIVMSLAHARGMATCDGVAHVESTDNQVDHACLTLLASAYADQVEPIAGERIQALGIDCEVQALVMHMDALRAALRSAEEGIGQSSIAVLRAIALGHDAGDLPRPWPLLGTVTRELGRAMERSSPAVRDRGLGGLVPQVSEGLRPRMNQLRVAELRTRAVSCARAADEGSALARSLAPMVVDLFRLMRRRVGISSDRLRSVHDRMAFERAVKHVNDVVNPDEIELRAVELLERAQQANVGAAVRLNRPQILAVRRVARGMAQTAAADRKPLSETGRALVVVAMAADVELARALERSTGVEALISMANRHGGRILQAAQDSL